MTDSRLRWARPTVALAPLQRKELPAARELCALRPAAYAMPAMHVELALADDGPAPGRLWAVRARDGGDLLGVVWNGVNLIPALPEPSPELLATLGDLILSRIARPSAVVGEAAVVLGLWSRVERRWGPARAIRDEQWLMTLDGPPRYVPPASPPGLEAVRKSRLDDFDALLPAAVHMFRGEVGYDPTIAGRGVYEERIRRLVRSGRSFVQFEEVAGEEGTERRVVFKAEVGVLGGGVAEIQGVWVEPTLRGRGLGKAGMAAVCEAVQSEMVPTVSLYVNSFNRAAIASYEAIGFIRVGTFATVML